MAIRTAQAQIQGRPKTMNLHEEAMRVLANQRSRTYEAHEFTWPAGIDYVSIKSVVDHAIDCSCGRAGGPFAVIERAQRVVILNDGGELKIKYNSAAADRLTIGDGLRHDWDYTEVEDIFGLNDTGSGIPLTFLLA